ncbi:hypothetical protein JYU34_016946 [Plutella xylostella]|uniref:Uncharacterized protein n=1 Tax=Plutella xylostella TaxID=51655 RepID=A0ABQ7Q3V6_PLUXY|nr:hypothetical protein JYU34_016946 [Plutella xylostella]
MPAYLRGFDSSLHSRRDEEPRRRRKSTKNEPASTATGEEATDTESDGSARSLDLASSHSSDDEETSNRRSTGTVTRGSTSNSGAGYLPNITEGAPLAMPPRWPHGMTEEGAPPMARWAGSSPAPLPAPDLTSDVYRRAPPHNYGAMEDELLYGMVPAEADKQIPYDPTYTVSPTMYRLPTNPYGSKTYLSSRTSDYGYSPTKYLSPETNLYGSRDFRDSGVTMREQEGYPSNYRDSGIATMLKNDYQRKMESQYGDYNDRMSEGSDKHHPHDKYLFPYTAEEDHSNTRALNQTPQLRPSDLAQTGEPPPQMGAPLASMGETSEWWRLYEKHSQ